MTYILGSRCSDGVLLVADRKIVENDGSKELFEEKIWVDASEIVTAASGSTVLYRKFRSNVLDYVNERKGGLGLQSFTKELERIVSELNRGYGERVAGGGLEVLVALKHVSGEWILKIVDQYAVGDDVLRYRAIGTGSPYGSVFMNYWRNDLTMEQVAGLGYFIIKYIEKLKLDAGVGVGDGKPRIWFMPHKEEPHRANFKFLDELEAKTQERLSAHGKHLDSLFTF